MKLILVTACAAGALMLLKTNGSATAAPAAGSIAGKATFDGERPEAKPDFAPKEEELKGCHHDGHAMNMKDPSLLLDEHGGIANVVVMVTVEGVEVQPRADPVVLDQMSCVFEPHVQVVRVGETVQFKNSDATNHNIHTYAKKNKSINNNVAGGSTLDMLVDKEEVISVKCDIHPWMSSYAIVTTATHFAVSKPDGSFEIADVPPGTYKAEWWHETLGKGKADVTVEEGKPATLELKLSADDKKGGGRRK
jgi:plastocyanin